MLLYKYRSFDNFEYIADILLNERLYCAHYESLNDPCEGFYVLNYGQSRYLSVRPPPPVTLNIGESPSPYYSINPKIDLNKKRVCSLSANLDEIRLWSYYAESHTGIAIAIEIDDTSVQSIEYHTTLPEFIPNPISLSPPQPETILSKKLNLWSFEEEYRIITDEEYFPIKNRIKAIYLGHRINPRRLELLKKLVPNIPIIETRLDPKQAKIIF